MDEETMIQANDIFKSFGSLQVLKGITMQVEKGEVVSIVGPSGAGKTTLLQIIGTLDKADRGQVIIDGTDVSSLSTKKAERFPQSEHRFCVSVSSTAARIHGHRKRHDSCFHRW